MPTTTTSSYLQYLPAIFSEEPLLGQFLLAFEHVLTGLLGIEPPQGLEEKIAQMARLFDPFQMATLFDVKQPGEEERLKEFLTWLAGWVALRLRADWTIAEQQKFLANIVPLYQQRGGMANLIELLRIYIGLEPEIEDQGGSAFQLGVLGKATLGGTIPLGGGAPHFFTVTVTMPNPDPAELGRKELIAKALIELQKPAHTSYALKFSFATMQLGVRSTIGKDTLLGNVPT